jgi:hypothetical protein
MLKRTRPFLPTRTPPSPFKRTPSLLLGRTSPLLLLVVVLLVSGCGGSSTSSATSSSSSSAGGAAAPEGSGALAADAKSAATGDIPDNQNFLTFSDLRLRVAMIYPEGWTVQQTASEVSIKNKNNLVRVSVSQGPAPTTTSVQAQIVALKRSNPTLTANTPQTVTLKSGPAVKVTYTTASAPNPVTGKQVTLMVDRYELAHAGRVAVVDLGTPTGVDNIEAYKRMIGSFRWL